MSDEHAELSRKDASFLDGYVSYAKTVLKKDDLVSVKLSTEIVSVKPSEYEPKTGSDRVKDSYVQGLSRAAEDLYPLKRMLEAKSISIPEAQWLPEYEGDNPFA